MPPPSTLLVFDAEPSGHHPDYVRYLLDALPEPQQAARVTLAVAQEMLDAHPDLVLSGAHLSPLSPQRPGNEIVAGSSRLWAQLCEAVRTHRPDAVLLLYGEMLLPDLARGARLPGHPGIATLHFRLPVRDAGPSFRERLRDVVKRRLLHRLFRHPDVKALFSLDPRPVPELRRMARHTSVVTLPDPVPNPTLTPEERADARRRLRESLGLGPDHRLMVLFGALDSRKGIFETLAAVRQLPPATAERLAVLFAGSLNPAIAESFTADLVATAAATPAHLTLRDGFIRDEHEVEEILGSADTVLIPYLRHVGSSGVLIRAARLQTPVVCQAYGLMGAWTREHALGRAVDTTNTAALAAALAEAVDDPVGAFDPVSAAAFAAPLTPAAFAAGLFGGLAPSMW